MRWHEIIAADMSNIAGMPSDAELAARRSIPPTFQATHPFTTAIWIDPIRYRSFARSAEGHDGIRLMMLERASNHVWVVWCACRTEFERDALRSRWQ